MSVCVCMYSCIYYAIMSIYIYLSTSAPVVSLDATVTCYLYVSTTFSQNDLFSRQFPSHYILPPPSHDNGLCLFQNVFLKKCLDISTCLLSILSRVVVSGNSEMIILSISSLWLGLLFRLKSPPNVHNSFNTQKPQGPLSYTPHSYYYYPSVFKRRRKNLNNFIFNPIQVDRARNTPLADWLTDHLWAYLTMFTL